MVASNFVLLEHIMIRWVKVMKLHVNHVQLVPTAQPVVEIVLMCALNVCLEHTVINLVSFDYDSRKLYLVYITTVIIQLFTKYLIVFMFLIFE
jgi:hypothetical protein